MYKVIPFEYNGLMVTFTEGDDARTNYTADFIKWTDDPGIGEFKCSDGEIRLIPSCCLIGEALLPKQEYNKKVLFGNPSIS